MQWGAVFPLSGGGGGSPSAARAQADSGRFDINSNNAYFSKLPEVREATERAPGAQACPLRAGQQGAPRTAPRAAVLSASRPAGLPHPALAPAGADRRQARVQRSPRAAVAANRASETCKGCRWRFAAAPKPSGRRRRARCGAAASAAGLGPETQFFRLLRRCSVLKGSCEMIQVTCIQKGRTGAGRGRRMHRSGVAESWLAGMAQELERAERRHASKNKTSCRVRTIETTH